MTAITPSQPDSSSSPDSPSSSRSPAVCWAAHITGLVVALAVAIPIGKALPGLLLMAAGPTREWQPAAAALVALGMVAAPVETIRAVKQLIPWRGRDRS